MKIFKVNVTGRMDEGVPERKEWKKGKPRNTCIFPEPGELNTYQILGRIHEIVPQFMINWFKSSIQTE
jgi:hypothetical protein